MLEDQKMEYQGFDLEISCAQSGKVMVAVTASPYHRPKEPFRIPFPRSSDRVMQRLEAWVVQSKKGQKKRQATPDLERIGSVLFRALCSGEVHECFLLSHGSIDGERNCGRLSGLRCRLFFREPEKGLAGLVSLPWELIFVPTLKSFLGLQVQTPIVRYLDTPTRIKPCEAEVPLRVLLVGAAPKDKIFEQLDLSREQQRIRDALKDQPAIEVKYLEPPTVDALRRELRGDTAYHVLHFMGHGHFNEETGEGALFFEDGAESWHALTGRELGVLLGGVESLRLVVLNTCSVGKLPRRNGQDVFSNVAAAATRAGVPAVVAMQFPISDTAAIAFSEAFYATLAHGYPIEAAVVEGRVAISGLEGRISRDPSREWITPVLYMRAADGMLFDISNKGEPMPIRLGIRSMIGKGEGVISETNHGSLSLLSWFVGRKPRENALWNTEIYPRVRNFLAQHVREKYPLQLNLAAHGSIAFAAGYFLEPSRGVAVTLVQRGKGPTAYWRLDDETGADGPSWEILDDGQFPEVPRDSGCSDVALAISLTWSIKVDVIDYLDSAALRVGRVLVASLPEMDLGHGAIASAAHAERLAQEVCRALRKRPPQERRGTVHIFTAAPNAFVFLLGRLAHGFGKVQLYEHDKENPNIGCYSPSMSFPPPAGAGATGGDA